MIILYFVYFAGPYYKYKTYIDMINNKRIVSLDTMTPFLSRFKWVPILGGVYIVLSHFYYIEVCGNMAY